MSTATVAPDQATSVQAWPDGQKADKRQKVMASKNFTLGNLVNDDADDELVKKLKALDVDGNGQYSAEEIINAARQILDAEDSEKQAALAAKRMTWITFGIGLLLFLSIICNFMGACWAIQLQKDAAVGADTGMMITERNGGPPKAVATASIKQEAPGLSGLKEASKQELDLLEELRFFHDGGYHRMKVSQLHRYDGRTEVWGMPVGVVVVEDTGEVHYSPHGTPSPDFDNCWGPSGVLAEVCGEAVDNEPPTDLDVEGAHYDNAEDAPANGSTTSGRRLVVVGTDGNGEPVHEVFEEPSERSASARRLSARRRTSISFSSSPRRRSGGSISSRRRSFGSTSSVSSSTAYTSYRRRGTVAVVGNYDVRRRSASYTSAHYSHVSYHSYYGAPYYSHGVDQGICGAGYHWTCDGDKCWCEQAEINWGTAVGIVIGVLVLCCCMAMYTMTCTGGSEQHKPLRMYSVQSTSSW